VEQEIYKAIVQKAADLEDKDPAYADAYLLNTLKATAALLKGATKDFGIRKLAEEFESLTAYYTEAYGDASFAKELTQDVK
jgi:hypothetical protein